MGKGVFLTSLILLSASLAARADGVGTPVTGTLDFASNPVNYFDPALGFVPAGDENASGTTVLISDAAIEFGYSDSHNTDTADFTGTTLTITDLDSFLAADFVMTFTDPAFTGFTEITGTSYGFTSSFSGDTLTVDYAGTTSPGTYAATFTYGPAAGVTPEPSSIVLFATGLLGVAGVVRRRLT